MSFDVWAELSRWLALYKASPELQLAGNFIFGSAGALLAIWLKRRHERAERSSWDAQKFFYIHEFLSHPQFFEARRHVRKNIIDNPAKLSAIGAWDPIDELNADVVCATYDQAASLFNTGKLIDPKYRRAFLESTWGDSIIHQYEALASYIQREKAKVAPTGLSTSTKFFDGFAELYAEAKKLRAP